MFESDEEMQEAIASLTPIGVARGRIKNIQDDEGGWRGTCPFCKAEGRTFSVGNETGLSCSSCEWRGDPLTFISKADGTGFRRTMETLYWEHYG